MRNVNNGWLLRYVHMHGALFFSWLYMFIYYGICLFIIFNTREPLWCTGVVCLL